MRAPTAASPENKPRVAAVGASLSLIVPIRLALGVAALIVALAAGARPRSAAAGFALGAAFLAFAALADRRGALLGRSPEPEPLPAAVRLEPWWRVAWQLMLPSTVVVTALAVVTLAAGSLVLGAILGGALAGMGVASAVSWVRLAAWEGQHGLRLFWELGGAHRRFVEPRGVREPTA